VRQQLGLSLVGLGLDLGLDALAVASSTPGLVNNLELLQLFSSDYLIIKYCCTTCMSLDYINTNYVFNALMPTVLHPERNLACKNLAQKTAVVKTTNGC